MTRLSDGQPLGAALLHESQPPLRLRQGLCPPPPSVTPVGDPTGLLPPGLTFLHGLRSVAPRWVPSPGAGVPLLNHLQVVAVRVVGALLLLLALALLFPDGWNRTFK